MTLRQSPLFLLAAAMLCLPASPALGDDLSPEPRRKFTRVLAPDGIQIRRYNKTDGPSPAKNDRVVVHYHGTLENGKVFDTTRRRGRAVAMRLDGAIPCWKKALPRLRVGERAQIVCPAEEAYGAKGSPPAIPGGARLTFEVELVGIH